MKKLFSILFLLAFTTAYAQVEKVLPSAPNPPKLVNDLTKDKFLRDFQREELEKKLVAYDDSTSTQIAVIIVDGTQGYPKDEYAVGLGNKWGVWGTNQTKNGVIILISTGKDDGKRTSFIATADGMEGVLPDLTVKAIIDNELIPDLKAGNHFQALDKTTDAIIKAAAGKYKAPSGYANRSKAPPGFLKIMAIIFIVFIILVIISKSDKNGGMMTRRGYHDWNGPVWFPRSGGGGGGGWSGGGGGFGGFGGSGGGGFSGGGAGGDW